jgi:hypothetical protein
MPKNSYLWARKIVSLRQVESKACGRVGHGDFGQVTVSWVARHFIARLLSSEPWSLALPSQSGEVADNVI